MKNLFVAVLALILAGSTASAQNLEEILAKHFEAISQEKLVKLENMRVQGRLLQMGVEIPFTQVMARPSSMRLEATFQGLTLVQTYNGKEGWNINPFAGVSEPQPFGEDEMKAMKYQVDLDGMLWKPADKGYTLTYDGTEEVEGTSCHKVKLETKDGDVFVYFLDADSFLPVKTWSKIKIQGNETESETFYSNYAQYDGIAMATKNETRMGGQVVNTILIDKVEFNIDYDKALFGKPQAK